MAGYINKSAITVLGLRFVSESTAGLGPHSDCGKLMYS